MGERADEIRPRGRDDGGAQDRETAPTSPPGGEAGTEEIRAAIEQTRAEMAETVDAIQAQLSPEHLKEQAKARAWEATVGRAQQAASRARETATKVREVAAGRAQQLTSRTPDTVKGAGSTISARINQRPIPVAVTLLVLGGLIIALRLSKRQAVRASSS